MKIVFDTNVLISGFLTATGPSHYVLGKALKGHAVILSEYILNELEEKLGKKLKIPPNLVDELISFLRKRAVFLEVPEESTIKFSDKRDIPILNLAQASKAHYFVTGDKRLLELKKLGPTVFLTPRELMEIL